MNTHRTIEPSSSANHGQCLGRQNQAHRDQYCDMDRDRLISALNEFDPTPDERRVVVRQAMDLADSGRYEADTGSTLSSAVVVRNLRDAPDDRLPGRWNWWIGSLTAAYGGYERFQVRVVNR